MKTKNVSGEILGSLETKNLKIGRRTSEHWPREDQPT